MSTCRRASGANSSIHFIHSAVQTFGVTRIESQTRIQQRLNDAYEWDIRNPFCESPAAALAPAPHLCPPHRDLWRVPSVTCSHSNPLHRNGSILSISRIFSSVQ